MDHKEGHYKVKDLRLAEAGRKRIEWAESRMPVLMRLREEFSPVEAVRRLQDHGLPPRD